MERGGIISGLRGVVRTGVRRLLEPVLQPRVSALASEAEDLRAELSETRDRVEELSELVERLDGLLRERE